MPRLWSARMMLLMAVMQGAARAAAKAKKDADRAGKAKNGKREKISFKLG